MTLLGNLSNITDEDELERNEKSVIPKVYNRDEKGFTLKKAMLLSFLLHPASVGLGWLLCFVLMFLGINLTILERPKMKTQDIEFVLVNNKEAPPIDKNTKNRADRNTRAGGKHDPKKPQAEPSPAPGAPSTAGKQQQAKPKATPAPQKQPQKQQPKQQPQQAPKQQAKPQATPQPQKPQAQPEPPKHVTPQPTPPAPRPAPVVSAPKTVENPTSAMQIPVPKTTAPKLAQPAGGPITAARAGSGTTGGSSSGASGSSRPTPSFTPSSTGASSSSGGRFSSGQYGTGQAGNPGPGNPNGAPGIDAIREPDFGPYMRELQRRIKMNWDPPKGNESKRVVLYFKIARDGRLLSVRVSRSSGVQAADRAAISAVELTAPFKPLPPEFKGQSVDIQFTFDYNVFSASRY